MSNGASGRWVKELPVYFFKAGLSNIEVKYLEPLPAMRKPWTDNFVVGLGNHDTSILTADPTVIGTKQEYEELLHGLEAEMDRGVLFDVHTWSVVGCKNLE